MGKKHGSLTRAGKVRKQTPKVEKKERLKKLPVGRAKKRRVLWARIWALGAAIRFPLHFTQHLVDVVVKRAVFAGIARRIDTRSSVQCLHLQTRVVGKTVHPRPLIYPCGFV